MSKLTDRLSGAMRSSLGVGTPAAAEAQAAPATSSNLYAGTRALSDTRLIPVARIVPDTDQPRKEFAPESLAELGLSLKRRGQLQPIRVREDRENDRFIIVSGERRWRAAKLMEIAELMCTIVKRPMSPGERLTDQLIENCIREDLKPIEQARAYKQLMGLNGWSTTQVGKELAIDQSSVSRALKLLELPEQVQELVEQGALPPRTAYEVSKLDRAEDQVEVATQAATERLTRAQVIEAITAKKAGRSTSAPRRAKYEYRAGGSTLSITGEAAAAGPDAILALLEEAMTDVRATEKLLDSTEAA